MTDLPLRLQVLAAFQTSLLTYTAVALAIGATLGAGLLMEYRRDPDAFYRMDDTLAASGFTPTGAVALIAALWPVVLWHLVRDHGRISA